MGLGVYLLSCWRVIVKNTNEVNTLYKSKEDEVAGQQKREETSRGKSDGDEKETKKRKKNKKTEIYGDTAMTKKNMIE